MNYLESFNKVIDQYGPYVLKDYFLVHSLLSDYVGNSFNDIQVIDAFYQINNEGRLCDIVENYSLEESKSYIKKIIAKCDKKYKPTQYIESVEPLLLHLFPNEYVPIGKKNIGNQSRSAKIVHQVNKKKVEFDGFEKLKNAILQKPSKNRTPKIEEITIFAYKYVDRLFVSFSETKNIKVYDGGNKDVSKIALSRVRNGSITVNFDENGFRRNNRDFYVEIPEKHYKNISIVYKGRKRLEIQNKESDKRIADYLSITSYRGNTYANVHAKTLYLTQNQGNIYVNGAYEYLYVTGDNIDFWGFSDEKVQKQINIKALIGNIHLYFASGKIQPKIKRLFHPVTKVNGAYNIGNYTVNLSLSTERGKIYVK